MHTTSLLLFRPGLLLLALLLLIGCGAHAEPPQGGDAQDTERASALDTDNLLTLGDVVDKIAGQRVVMVGEIHTRKDHHDIQLAVLRAMHRQSGERLAIGVEWFQRPFQKPLDDYIAGRISEADMLERTDYFNRWSFDWRLYRPILSYAREHRIPVIALNARAELTRRVGDVGLDGLSTEERAQLPQDYDRSDTAYEARMQSFFGGHPGSTADGFQRFFDVQLTWEETMAETAAKWLAGHPDSRMLILAGSGHLAFRSGIPNRLQRRLPDEQALILVNDGGNLHADAADYLIFSQPIEMPPRGLLGVLLAPASEGVLIEQVAEDSAAAAAGIKDEDVILAIDGAAMASVSAVKLALLDKQPGDVVTVTYQRQSWLGSDREKTVEVALGGQAEMSPR